jgi:hypothetical protein
MRPRTSTAAVQFNPCQSHVSLDETAQVGATGPRTWSRSMTRLTALAQLDPRNAQIVDMRL